MRDDARSELERRWGLYGAPVSLPPLASAQMGAPVELTGPTLSIGKTVDDLGEGSSDDGPVTHTRDRIDLLGKRGKERVEDLDFKFH